MKRATKTQIKAFKFTLSPCSFKILSAVIVALLVSTYWGPEATGAASEMKNLIAAAKKEGSVNFYTGLTEKDNVNAAKLFKAKYGINVDIFRANTNQVLQRYDLEWKAGNVKADVLALADATASARLQQRGMLMRYEPPATKTPGYIAKFGGTHFQVLGLTVWGAAWNSEKVKGAEVPTDFHDFLKPRWKGKLGMLDASVSLVGLQQYYILRTALGADFLKQLGAQNLRFLSPNNAIAEQIVSGELFGAPILILNVAVQFKQKKAPLGYGYMKTGVPVLTRTLQISAKARKSNAAKLFVNWLLSKEGQEGFQKVARSMPPRSDVTVEGMPAPGSFEALPVDNMAAFVAKQKDIRAEFIRLFKEK
jgi:iron(III) transport system substrate-binding protein